MIPWSRHKFDPSANERMSAIDLQPESVNGLSDALQRVDDIVNSDGLAVAVFAVGYTVPQDLGQVILESASGFVVDSLRDALDSTSPRQSPYVRLGDTMDGIPAQLPMFLDGKAPSETTSHVLTEGLSSPSAGSATRTSVEGVHRSSRRFLN